MEWCFHSPDNQLSQRTFCNVRLLYSRTTSHTCRCELTGTLVAVHPETSFDPANMQGKIGIITAADIKTDDFYVSFGKGEQARYPGSTLLVLREGAQMYQDMLTQYKNIDKQDFKDLFEINLLQQQGQTRALKDAMEIALKSDVLRKFGMVTLEDKLSIQVAKKVDQVMSKSMSLVR